jgi:hypothetical protein
LHYGIDADYTWVTYLYYRIESKLSDQETATAKTVDRDRNPLNH